MPQRPPSPSGSYARTSSSGSGLQRRRPITDRTTKIGDRCSPGPDSVNQKKQLGTRIVHLESQLGQAQEELKLLKHKMACAQIAKREAQRQLKKNTANQAVSKSEGIRKKQSPIKAPKSQRSTIGNVNVDPVDILKETDVFEVPVETKTIEVKKGPDCPTESHLADKENMPDHIPQEPEKLSFCELGLKDAEINMLKKQLLEKENELNTFSEENQNLKSQLNQATSDISSAKANEEKLSLKMTKLAEELEEAKAKAAELKDKLDAAKTAKEALEKAMKTMEVQTEQWRKAADAAAPVLAGAADVNGMMISGRCGSIFGGIHETPVGNYSSFMASPAMDEELDAYFRSGKQKGSAVKMFGDLWRKMGAK